ncbi:MAG: hypothetical protein NC416_15345 [Eubacterium sp.]|nr:hypothetical protein [Eubacterium sp.]
MSMLNMVASMNESTVVSEYTPESKRSDSYQSETEFEKELINAEKGENKMHKPICHCSIALHPLAKQRLEEVYEIREDQESISDAEAALCYGVPAEWCEKGRAENLRVIGCHSCGQEAAEWAAQKGIQITLADSLWRTVAEHTLALMMAAARNIVPADRQIREGNWREHTLIKEQFSGFDFQGKTLGILGMGQIGVHLADMVKGFHMRVCYYDIRRLSEQEEQEMGISFWEFDDLLRVSDYLCILVPLNESTTGLIGKDAFAKMKKGCILVNTARAGILDEEAFLEALEDGTLTAAGLDVFWKEGAKQKEELTRRDNVVMTPHLGGSTYECDRVLVDAVCAPFA